VRNLAIPTNTMDARVPIAADKGPYSTAGSALGVNNAGQGAVSDTYRPVPPQWTWPISGRGKPNDYNPFNSPNHGGLNEGEGQNSLYPDGHAEFSRRPDTGMNADNIYTQSEIPYQRGSAGIPPSAGNDTPLTSTDSLIYP
jgi:hypothetical protein